MTEDNNRGKANVINKAKAKEKINAMLECLLSQDGMNCNTCKKCNDVDTCCFLMDAVFVIHYKNTEIKKSRAFS